MPFVRVKAAPREQHPGWWALGKSGSYALDGAQIDPPKGGTFFPNGADVDLEVTDDELLELQSPPNDAYLVVVELPGPTLPPVNRDVPFLSGTPTVGSVLHVTMGNWDNAPTSYAYAWKGDGVDIAGAAAADYRLTAKDVGTKITAVVTATNAIGSATAPPSNEVGPIS